MLPVFLTTLLGNPAARLVSTRPIEKDVLTPAMFERVSAWLAECLEGKARGTKIHTRCPSPANNILPKRLIEISAGEGHEHVLKVVESDGLPTSSYIALSYCWGGDQPL